MITLPEWELISIKERLGIDKNYEKI